MTTRNGEPLRVKMHGSPRAAGYNWLILLLRVTHAYRRKGEREKERDKLMKSHLVYEGDCVTRIRIV